jgi:hypothetical protein
VSDLETIQYVSNGRTVICPDWNKIPGEEARKVSCKRRDCPRCGVNWARDWSKVNELNLEAYGGQIVMVTITAPGEDRLPWDEAHCARRRTHRHSGPAGCRVQQRAAREWSDTLTWRWSKLRKAAILATQRQLAETFALGPAPSILERAYEPQKRGVPHLHLVLGYRTRSERDAAHVFVGHLKRLAGEYDFGFADGSGKKRGMRNARPVVERHGIELRPMTGRDAARYLANYLTGRNPTKKSSIRENISHPTMPRSLLWLTPALTSVSSSERIGAMRERLGIARGTGVTMRMLRRARHFFAALEGRCPAPNWRDTTDALLTLSVFLQAFHHRGPPVDLRPALETAAYVDQHVRRESLWSRYPTSKITEFATDLLGKCMPLEPLEGAA